MMTHFTGNEHWMKKFDVLSKKYHNFVKKLSFWVKEVVTLPQIWTNWAKNLTGKKLPLIGLSVGDWQIVTYAHPVNIDAGIAAKISPIIDLFLSN